MIRFAIFWAIHFGITVTGWYSVATLAQAVLDSTGIAPFPLVVLNELVMIFMMPIVSIAIAFAPNLGLFTLSGFFGYVIVAAINSALVIGLLWIAYYAIQKRRTTESN